MPVQRTRSLTGNQAGENIYSHHTIDNPASHHLPPLTSQTVGGSSIHHGNQAGVKVQQLYEQEKIENKIQNGDHSYHVSQLPSVRATSSAESQASKGSSAKRTGTMTPESAMKQYMHKLSSFEHHEIFNYPHIYFVGANAKKRQGVVGGPSNNGYDDENGSYVHVPHDHIG